MHATHVDATPELENGCLTYIPPILGWKSMSDDEKITALQSDKHPYFYGIDMTLYEGKTCPPDIGDSIYHLMLHDIKHQRLAFCHCHCLPGLACEAKGGVYACTIIQNQKVFMTSLLPQQETEIYQAERLERDITPIRMRPRSPPVTHIDGKDLYE